MIRLLITTVLLVAQISADAQAHLPFQMEGAEPRWTQLVVLDEIPSYAQRHVLKEEPIYSNGYIYTTHNVRDTGFYGWVGPIIQKIDLETGTLEWQYDNYNLTKYEREHVHSTTLLEDETLELLIFDEENAEPNGSSSWHKGHLATARLSAEDGAVIATHETDHADTLNYLLASSHFFSAENFQNHLRRLSDSLFLYIKKNPAGRSSEYRRFMLREDGSIDNVDVLELQFSDLDCSTMFAEEISEGRKVSVIVNKEDEVSTTREFAMTYVLFDEVFDTIKTVNLKPSFTDSLDYASLEYAGDDHFIVKIRRFMIEADTFFREDFLLYDLDGRLIDRNYLELDSRVAFADWVQVLPFYNPIEDELLLFSSIVDNPADDTELLITRSLPDMSLDTLFYERIVEGDYADVDYARVLEDGDLLLHVTQKLIVRGGPFQSYIPIRIWPMFMRFDGSAIGLTTSVVEMEGTAEYSIYPNPASEYVTLDGLADVAEITIYDAMGAVVCHRTVRQDDRVDVSDLTSGYYWMVIETGQGVETHKLVRH